MATSIDPIPKGYHTVTPYLIVPEVTKLMEFLAKAFDSQVIEKIVVNNVITHAVVKIGDSMVMMGEARGEHKPMPAMFYLYVEDIDTVYKKALAAGGQSLMQPVDQFYGDRNAGVQDHCGNQWWIGTRKENLSQEEIQTRTVQHSLQKSN